MDQNGPEVLDPDTPAPTKLAMRRPDTPARATPAAGRARVPIMPFRRVRAAKRRITSQQRHSPSPRRGEGWGEGDRTLLDSSDPTHPALRADPGSGPGQALSPMGRGEASLLQPN